MNLPKMRCIDEVRTLRNFSDTLLIYLYYALDNRPWYFRFFLKTATSLRLILCKVRNKSFRRFFSYSLAILVYKPLILLGQLLQVCNWGRFIPLYEYYSRKSLQRIEQDVYDRFFTSIEQRVSREQIMTLADAYSEVILSDQPPYWHFLYRTITAGPAVKIV